MSKFKAAIVVVAVAAFFGLCIWLSPNLFGNRIRGELTKDSILKYDSGAKVYIASKDDNSKVFFGQSSKYRFYGTGALTMMESPNSTYSNFRSGFNLLIEGGNLELKTGQADILTGSVSPNGQFLALLKVDGKLSIYEISTGKTTYETDKSHFVENPLNTNLSSYPYFYWSDQGLITIKTQNHLTEGALDPTDWLNSRRDTDDRLTKPKSATSIDDSSIESIDPSTGNANQIDIYQSESEIKFILGAIDSKNLLVITIQKDKQPQICSFNLETSTLTKLSEYNPPVFGYYGNKLFYAKDSILVYSKVTFKGLETPIKIDLPKLDDEQLNPDNIENLRVTSKGYLYFRHIKTAKTYLLEPVSGVYVEIPKERYPY